MEGITYSIRPYHSKFIIRLDDPVFSRPWYLKSIGPKSGHDWTSDSSGARCFSLRTAQKHVEALQAGADTDWERYHNSWKEYYAYLDSKKKGGTNNER